MPHPIRLLALGSALVCLALPALRSQPEDSANLPLPETYFPALKGILSAAVKQSPRMIARNAENAASEGNRIVMRSGQLPSVSGYFAYYPWDRQVRADLPGATDSNKLSYNLTLNQPVYHWGALRNNTRIGELQLRMTQGQTAEGYRLLVEEIRSQYLGLVIKKVNLEKSRLARMIAEAKFAAAQDKLAKKVIAEADLFLPTVSRDQAQLAADEAEEDYQYNKRIFAKLCGAPVLADEQIPDQIPDAAGDAPAFSPMLTAYTSQPEPSSYNLSFISNQIAVEKLNYQNIATRLRPQLNLLAGTSQDQISYTTNLAAKYKVREYFTGLQATWSIFDGLATSGAKASSMARRRQLEQSYRDLSADLRDQARNQLKLVGFARRNMDITNRILDSSVGALRDKKADAARGLASETDVNTFQLQFQEAQLNAFIARSDYLMKSADFLSAILQDPALANLPAKP